MTVHEDKNMAKSSRDTYKYYLTKNRKRIYAGITTDRSSVENNTTKTAG